MGIPYVLEPFSVRIGRLGISMFYFVLSRLRRKNRGNRREFYETLGQVKTHKMS
jgi:hypothetical protein